ncbi:hypothetical protein MRX96_043371 [Rhipicephalus microplus]
MPGYDPAVVGIADGQNAPDGLCVDACGFLAKPQALPVDVADVARQTVGRWYRGPQDCVSHVPPPCRAASRDDVHLDLPREVGTGKAPETLLVRCISHCFTSHEGGPSHVPRYRYDRCLLVHAQGYY